MLLFLYYTDVSVVGHLVVDAVVLLSPVLHFSVQFLVICKLTAEIYELPYLLILKLPLIHDKTAGCSTDFHAFSLSMLTYISHR